MHANELSATGHLASSLRSLLDKRSEAVEG